MSFRRSSLFLWELFGWEPQQIFDQIFNVVETTATRAYASITTFAAETNEKANGLFSNELERGEMSLKLLFSEAVDRALDKFEVYAYRNVLRVPPELIQEGWMRTPEQQGVDFTDVEQAKRVAHRLDQLTTHIEAKQQQLLAKRAALEEIQAQKRHLEAVLEDLPSYGLQDQEKLHLLLAEIAKLDTPVPQRERTPRDELNDLVMAS